MIQSALLYRTRQSPDSPETLLHRARQARIRLIRGLVRQPAAMRILQCGLATVALLAGVASLAGEGGTTAEQIRSRELCRQAVSRALRAGDSDARSVYCGFASYDPPAYWQCVLARVRQGQELAAARSEC
jgi:hypothetical protein